VLTAALFCHRRPTGDEEEEDDTPMSDDERSYYAIQVCVTCSSWSLQGVHPHHRAAAAAAHFTC
jgi:hypothetical protein